jgi:WD40 repeat protein/predicted Ser/Thr protein kinase
MRTHEGPSQKTEQAPLARRVLRVIEEVIQRRRDEVVSDAEIIDAHPDLMPELAAKLDALRRVEMAEQWASSEMPPLGGQAPAVLPADSFPGYDLKAEVHRGGQGVVYRAVQKATRRDVAIKVMREGPFAGPSDRARFEREVRILGRLKHPNIVTIHESGQSGGTFFFVMDYIDGEPLDAWAAAQSPPIRQALEVFAKVCEAVNAAHLQGIIHRDLKPTNIRVGADGEPHVLDFGLAKVDPGRSDADSLPQAMTITGQFVGSLPWASPEQIQGVPANMDLRTDVYSLGLILYHLLTGRFPYDVIGSMHEVMDNILKVEPIRPRSFHRDIDDELETIVLKCLSKGRERRYQTAGELARDIRHYLAGEPIEAKRDSAIYLLRKTVRRYRVPVIAASAFVVLLAAAMVASTALWRRAEFAAEREQQQRVLAVQRTEQAVRAQSDAEAARAAAQREQAAAEQLLYYSKIGEAAGFLDRELTASARRALSECPVGLRHWEWGWLARLADVRPVWSAQHGALVQTVAFGPDGRLYSGGENEWVRVWDVSGQAPALSLAACAEGVWEIAFSPDGKCMAVVGDSCPALGDSAIALWDLATQRQTRLILGHSNGVYSVCFSPDGRYLATGGGDKTARLWDVETGREVRSFAGHTAAVLRAAITADGQFLVTASGVWGTNADTTTRVWEIRTGRQLHVIAGSNWRQQAVAPAGRAFACALQDTTIGLFDAATGQQVKSIQADSGEYGAVAFSPDGGRLAWVGRDNTLKMCQIEGDKGPVILGESEQPLMCLAFSTDGARIASGSLDGTVCLWDAMPARTADGGNVDLGGAFPESVDFGPDGQTVAVGTAYPNQRFLQVHDADTGRMVWRSSELGVTVGQVRFHPDGRRVVVSTEDGLIHVWDVVAQQRVLELRAGPGQARPIAISPDGRRLAAGTRTDPAAVWDLQTGRLLYALEDSDGGILSLAWSPDGALIAGGRAGVCRIWDARDGHLLHKVETEVRRSFWTVHFAPAGHTVLAGSLQGVCCVIDADAGKIVTNVQAHRDTMTSMAISPDGRRLATVGDGNATSIWDTTTWRKVLTLWDHKQHVRCVAFSPDGRTLATVGHDGLLILRAAYSWDDQHSQRADAK